MCTVQVASKKLLVCSSFVCSSFKEATCTVHIESLIQYCTHWKFESVLLIKPEHHDSNDCLFHGRNLSIASDGIWELGAPIGNNEFVTNWVKCKVQSWVDEITCLSNIALSQPQSAFSALTHGGKNHWTFVRRTCPNIDSPLLPIEITLRTVFLPALTSQGTPNDLKSDLFSLPCYLGGLEIPNPCLLSPEQYSNFLSLFHSSSSSYISVTPSLQRLSVLNWRLSRLSTAPALRFCQLDPQPFMTFSFLPSNNCLI